MANSYILYSGDGITTNFSFSFSYLSQEHIKVEVDGASVPFTFLSANTVTIDPAPAAGAVIKIYRQTPGTALVDFHNGAVLLENDLDTATNQAIMIAAEAVDDAAHSIRPAFDNNWDGGLQRIKNVADPVDPQDVVTKAWAETAPTSFLNEAIAARDAAQAAQAGAEAARDAAGISETNAATSASQASTSASQASTSASQASTSASQASTSASQASTSASQASSSASAAATSETNAASSATTATTASADAVSARDLALQYRDKAQKWAEEAVDIEVEPGLFSAKHWARQAELLAGSPAIGGKNNNDYIKIPFKDRTTGESRELIIQWGANYGTNVTTPYPIAFPNGVSWVLASARYATVGWGTSTTEISTYASTTTWTHWLAIGW